ncbi:MAG: phosphotransferase family protein [Deltaproteobacteria bacterium]|nr:phosphotransferase family protein [Deltaproteobacteria bacterium]
MTSPLVTARASIEAAVTEHLGPDATVSGIKPLHGGACQDNVRVDITLPDGSNHRMVVRSDAPSSIPGTLDRRAEYDVLRAATAAGVRTPGARWLTQGLLRAGAWAYFLDWSEGVAIGRKVLKTPELAAARSALPGQLAAEAARVHSITPDTEPGASITAFAVPEDGDPVLEGVRLLREMIDRLAQATPATEFIYRWLKENPPPSRELTLVHGDFRTGNFMVGPLGLENLLDWEFSRWSSPFEDLAWMSVRDWRFGRLNSPIGGFAQREPFYAAYTEASGRAVDAQDIHWWEINGNLRWAVGCQFQAQRYAEGQRDLELIAIGRRAAEMEYEALRLIDGGLAAL